MHLPGGLAYTQRTIASFLFFSFILLTSPTLFSHFLMKGGITVDSYQLELNRLSLLDLLQDRRRFLAQLIEESDSRIRKRPPGMLRTTTSNKCPQYYWKAKPSDSWKYLPKKERDIACRIVDSEYYALVREHAESELKIIDKLITGNSISDFRHCLSKLTPGRQNLVDKIFPSDEEILQSFLSENYDSYDSYTESMMYDTPQGESVRSKSEWMIAETLSRYNIPYQYEYPLYLDGLGLVHPDFRCLNLRKRQIIIWEHQGRMGDPDYAAHAIRKIQVYEENGFNIGENLIVTEESLECPLRTETIERWIQRLLV